MSSTIVFAISFFAISSAVAEPIRLNLLRRGSGDTEAFQEICDCLGDGYVAGADEAALKSPGSEEERADIACTFLRVSNIPSVIPSAWNYRKIPKISPGAYIFQRPFLRGLYSEGLMYGGKFAFQNRLN